VLDGGSLSNNRPAASDGGGVGVLTEWTQVGSWWSPEVTLTNLTLADNPLAGAYLNLNGSYQFDGCSFSNAQGILINGVLPANGNGIVALNQVGSWDGNEGLLVQNSDFGGNAGVDLLLDDSSATLSGNTYTAASQQVIQQDCTNAAPLDLQSDPADVLVCPAWDLPLAPVAYRVFLEAEDLLN